MALRISGGDWSPWAGVAHQMVGEQQGERALNLRAQQLRDARRAQRAQEYMYELGLTERKRQFDAELGYKYFHDQLVTAQKAADLQYELDERGWKRGLDEVDQAIRKGAVLDTTSGQWRPINEDDELWQAHQEYRRTRRTTVNKNVELNRRIRFIDSKIRNQEKMLAELRWQQTQAEMLNKPNPQLDTEVKKLQEAISEDRKVYNQLYSRFFKGYQEVTAPPPPPPGVEAPAPAGPAAAAPAAPGGGMPGVPEVAAPEAGSPMIGGTRAAPDVAPETISEHERLLAANQKRFDEALRFDGNLYEVNPKHRERVKADKIRMIREMVAAQRSGNKKRLAAVMKERANYIKKHKDWFIFLGPDQDMQPEKPKPVPGTYSDWKAKLWELTSSGRR